VAIQPSAFALESGGTTGLILDCATSACGSQGRLSRVTLSSGAVTPLYTGLNNSILNQGQIAPEANGTSALVTDCGPSGGNCASAGRLLRVTFSGALSVITPGLNIPGGIAIETGGTTA